MTYRTGAATRPTAEICCGGWLARYMFILFRTLIRRNMRALAQAPS
jgi:hypothetical protein